MLRGGKMAKLQIKEIAQKQGIKQYELAEKSGVSAQLVNRYWNNYMQRVALDELERIAKVLGVKPGDLIVPDEESVQNSSVDEAA
jgi:DNA-binding Xre family transcriptional regulator